MDIVEELSKLHGTDPAVMEFTYTDVADPATGGGDAISIRYVKNGNGYYSAVSTRYTQTEQPYVRKVGDDMSGELTNSTRFDGGFAIENRNLLDG